VFPISARGMSSVVTAARGAESAHLIHVPVGSLGRIPDPQRGNQGALPRRVPLRRRCGATSDGKPLLESNADKLLRPPSHPTRSPRRSGAQRELELIRYFVDSFERDAGTAIGQIDKNARKTRATCNDLGAFENTRAFDGSTFVHPAAKCFAPSTALRLVCPNLVDSYPPLISRGLIHPSAEGYCA
jgi:hypothetical protein